MSGCANRSGEAHRSGMKGESSELRPVAGESSDELARSHLGSARIVPLGCAGRADGSDAHHENPLLRIDSAQTLRYQAPRVRDSSPRRLFPPQVSALRSLSFPGARERFRPSSLTNSIHFG